MATRSTIAMEQPCGKIMQIYCHWDGYLDHNGEILAEHYQDSAKIYALMMLGDISSLGSTIGEPHDFDNKGDRDCCTAYGRDRGETGTEARVFQDFEDYKKNHQYEEFEYCYRLDGEWYVSQYQREYELLVKAIDEAKVMEDT